MSQCHFIPPYLLQKVASSHDDVGTARCGHATLAIDEQLRSHRQASPPGAARPGVAVAASCAWTIHTADNGSSLPGAPVRSADEPASGDAAVDEAYAGVQASLTLFRDAFGRESYDGRGAPVIATVHYERNYDNAFWDGTQLVFGGGGGRGPIGVAGGRRGSRGVGTCPGAAGTSPGAGGGPSYRGFAGISVSGEVDLEHDARAAELRELIGRIDFRAAATSGQPQPDRFVYAFRVSGEEVVVQEQALTPELSRLASLVLERDPT